MNKSAGKTEASKCSTKCDNPDCEKQDVMDRGPSTRRPMSEFNEGNGCPQYEPKLIGTVDMGPNASIDLKIARTGVRGNRLRTDYVAAMLENLLEQADLDRLALQVLSHRGMRASLDWFEQNAQKTDEGNLKPLVDIFVKTHQISEMKIFQILATFADADIPIIVTTRTEEKVEITFILFSKTGAVPSDD